MEKGHTELTKDGRDIRAIYPTGPFNGGGHVTGERGVTKIVAYDEHGPGDWIPWVAVMVGDRVWLRIPAHHLFIHYF